MNRLVSLVYAPTLWAGDEFPSNVVVLDVRVIGSNFFGTVHHFTPKAFAITR
jgi:hypothetical protein